MKPSHTPAPPLLANAPQKPRHPLLPAIATACLLLCLASPLQAAITWSGEIDPTDPTTWTSSTDCYIGKSSTGTITVDEASALQNRNCYVGHLPGSSGTVSVIGTGSKWTCSGLLIGACGSGFLIIAAGGQFSDSTGYLGTSSSGTATVTGFGSKWSNSNNLYVGYSGTGSLNIDAGGQVSNVSGYIGYDSGSSGTVTVSGTGSTWINSGDLNILTDGNSTLTVNDGGTVVVGGSFYASSKNLLGNGTISANGGMLDANLVFDAAHGSQGTSIFGSGGTLAVTPSAGNDLGVGYKDIGTLRITEGISVASSAGYLGYNSGASGTATVTGSGSKWSNSKNLYVGYSGTGLLNIDAGGQVSNVSGYLGYDSNSSGTVIVNGAGSTWINSGDLVICKNGNSTLTVNNGGMVVVGGAIYASLDSLLGNGTISANGGVVDADLVFDAAHGLNNSFAFGSGGILTINQSASNALGVGYKDKGTLRITDGVAVASPVGCLGHYPGSIGKATVSGVGSKWTNSAVYIGDSGTGSLNIEAGGQVSSAWGGVGYKSGSFGTATVIGIGSKWTITDKLYIGDHGNGILNIEAGGQVSNTSGYIGYEYDSTGMVRVSGVGSMWNNSLDLYFGGNGSLTVDDGGKVIVGGSLFASNLFGNGTISANGGIVDADLVFDAAHRLKATSTFGSGGILTITRSASNPLGVGHRGNGTLRIAEGVVVTSSHGCLGNNSGSSGTATVTGTGSKWTTNNDLYVGNSGAGILNIEAGGLVSNTSGYLGYYSGSCGKAIVTGNGSKWTNSSELFLGRYGGTGSLIINSGGQVSNTNGYLGYSSGTTGMATVTGVGSQWNNSGYLYVGNSGAGALNIESGGQVSNTTGYLGYASGTTGTATVTGVGSQWTNSGKLYVGKTGNGTLNIESGGQVSNTDYCYLGYGSGTTGTVTVTGSASKWTNSALYVGYSGGGTLKIEDGGQVSSSTSYLGCNSGSNGTASVTGTGSMWTINGNLIVGWSSGTLTANDGGTVAVNGPIYASLNSLFGNGTISATGGVVDADFVFDAAHGLQNSFVFGSGGTLTITQSANNPLGVGYKGNGTLQITEGMAVASSYGYVGYGSGSTGTATVNGKGSKWINSNDLYVDGTLNVEAGGQVSSDFGYVGSKSGSSGTVRVSGIGSAWTNSDNLYIGDSGTGALNITDGGKVSSYGGYLGSSSGTGTAIVSGAGSTWTNSGALLVGGSGSGTLTVNDGGTVIVGGAVFASLNNLFGNGTISANGVVLDADLVFDAAHGPQHSFTFGSGGTLMVNKPAYGGFGVGFKDNGTLLITDGVTVVSSGGYLGYVSGSNGTATVTGNGSKWINSYELYVGIFGNGTLNIGSGIASDGLVSTKSLILSYGTSSTATCNLNGGTLQTSTIKGGATSFNWSDGTIRNYDASNDLTIGGANSFSLKLASTGTHAFYIDAGRKGTVSTILSDATSGGTLEKQGDGLLTLSGKNSYTGITTIAAGTLALGSSGTLASSPIDVKSGATFDVSAKKGYVLAAGKTLTGAGTIVGDLSVGGIHAPGNSTGIETVKGNYSLLGELQIELAGTAAGTGYDEVLISGSSAYKTTLSGTLSLDWTNFTGSTDSTQLWIVRNDTAGTLSGAFSNYVSGASLGLHDGRSWNLYYNADAATGNPTGGNDVLIAPVPEPAAIVLLALSALALFAWSRKRRA
jgi:T5SS/PEP-CTERM-associated repeat protein